MFPEIKTYTIITDKIGRLSRPLSFLLLSDLHGDSEVSHIYSLLKAAEELKPDLIFSSGDMLLSKPDSEINEIVNLFRDLAFVAPVFAVDGNHEMRIKSHILEYGTKYKIYEEMIKSFGINVLHNESRIVEMNGCRLRIFGYDLQFNKYKKFMLHRLGTGDITEKIGESSNDCYNILLTHNPAFAKSYFKWGADLVMSGHYHGGLIRIGEQPLASPYGFLLPKFGYGLKEFNDSHIVVSGGLGNHNIPVRIGNPKELVNIIIKNSGEINL